MKSERVRFFTEPDRKQQWKREAARHDLSLTEWISRVLDEEVAAGRQTAPESLRSVTYVNGVEIISYG